MRTVFSELLAESIQLDERIWVLTGDLGFGVLNKTREAVPERFLNVGAAEQLMLGTAVGLAHNKKIPLCYSITPFLIFRPFEYIRNYVSHEGTPIKLIGSGRGKDYGHLGFSHWATDDDVLDFFPNIIKFRPNTEQDLRNCWENFLYNNKPSYLNITRSA